MEISPIFPAARDATPPHLTCWRATRADNEKILTFNSKGFLITARIMKNFAKALVVFTFALAGLFIVSGADMAAVLAQVAPKPTPTPTPAANPSPATTAAPTPAPAASPTGSGTGKKITKNFTLGKDSASEHGDVPFDHETHAEGKYSPDGKSVIACVECHHTDQPKSALKLPLVTSERSVTLTMDVWRSSTQKVSECRTCHFQKGNIPDGKEMPVLDNGQELDNEYSYHQNCNTCHDAAARLRPTLKGKKGFATGNDCFICHVKK
jgi:hypothetical protein